ncbi:MAG: NAD(P)-binding domain-containing protein, partial [Deltaproteobacteria bacterium]|nr:NAD(P)-binding domain-containing protein [Deltaproteobacteria bacterium]
MKIGFVGLGKMGGRMVERLMNEGHAIVAYDPIEAALKEAEMKGAIPVCSFEELVERLETPRAVWIMVPSGGPTEETIASLSSLMEAGDLIIDGGNSFYKDSMKRAQELG